MDKRKEDTRVKGDIAEKLFEVECLKRNIPYFIPGNSNSRADYLVWADGEYKRTQIKYISSYDGKIVVSFTKSQNGRKNDDGSPMYLKYDSDEIDLFIVYNPESDAFYSIDLKEFGHQRGLTLRLDPPKNTVPGIKLAKDFLWSETPALTTELQAHKLVARVGFEPTLYGF